MAGSALDSHAAAALAALPDQLVSVQKDTVSAWFTRDAKKAGVGGSLHRSRHTLIRHCAYRDQFLGIMEFHGLLAQRRRA